MKRLILVFAGLLAWLPATLTAEPAPLTTLQAVHALSNAEAARSLPVAFEATVTYFRAYERTLFVQDGDVPLYVRAPTNLKLAPGDRVLVRGVTRSSFHPDVVSDSITLLRHGPVPKPIHVNYDQAIRGEPDCLLVTMRGVVKAADIGSSTGTPFHYTNLQLLTDGGYIAATMDSDDTDAPQKLLDAEVEIDGVISGKFDGKMQQTGVLMHISSLADVRILKPADASPWSIPLTPMDQVLRASHALDLTQRVRVQGTITFYQPGSRVILQSGSKSLWIMTETQQPLRLGDLADASGFPDVRDGFLTLARSEVRDSQIQAPVLPLASNWKKLASSGNIFDLVSIEGTLITEVREATLDDYVVLSEGHIFSAVFRHANIQRQASLEPMKQIPLGSRIRVTGICMNLDANPFNGPVPFNILMRNFDDVVVVAGPGLFTVRNLTLLVILLMAVVLAAGARSLALERSVRQKTAALAARIEAEAILERTRSAILESIGENRPLDGILEQITGMVSAKLGGAPCWCETARETGLIGQPPRLEAYRIARAGIVAHSGEPLGALFAALAPGSQPSEAEIAALDVGGRLATLAIESRRLYADLHHRSEFDMLTDIHNRFSMENRLEAEIGHAQGIGAIFGLIFIDLDGFKEINDRFGHHAGDAYLRVAAQRMKNQLRPIDMLARLGGDEFAALIPEVFGRAEVEEIARRLERSFDEPISVEGVLLSGSASVGIALYPHDGATRDSLLQAADAAMYTAKHTKRDNVEMLDTGELLDLQKRTRR